MADIRRTPQLDDFQWGADENPISHGGDWATLDYSGGWSGLYGGGFGSVASQGYSWSYWTGGPYSGDRDLEVWGLANGGQLGIAGEGWRLGMMMADSVGGTGAVDGYHFGWYKALFSFPIKRRFDNAASTEIGTDVASGPVWDRYCLLRRDPLGNFEFWVDDDGTGANWTLHLTATDNTYTGPFYLALQAEDPTSGGVGWANFGGGSLANRPQIYRWIKN